MNYLKTTVTGIDEKIKPLQTYLYDNIINKWGLSNFDGYGRVYKNRRKDLIIPEYYISNKEYKEVLLSDKRDGIMFFSPSSKSKSYGDLIVQECDIMFSLNLKTLYNNNERQDEEARQYILGLLNQYMVNLGDKEIETDLRFVYKDYNGVASYFYDMQEFHHFKIKIELRFNNKTC